MAEELLTDADVAELLDVGQRWVAEEAKAGRFPHLKFGRKRRYTQTHVTEIVQICEQRPRTEPPRRTRMNATTPPSGAVRLSRKTPNRLRSSS